MVIIQGQRYSLCGAITIYFFCFLHPLSNSFASPTRSMCRPDQRDILLEFKSEFPKEEFSEFPKFSASLWDENGDCCSWDGVTCDGTFGKVISLQLMSYSGNNSLKFNSALFKLQNLRQLRLSNCYLYGEISSSFGNLSRLTYLDLSQNQLVGEFPISIGNLNQLTYLSLSENNLHGNIPISLANLTKLSQLDLSENQFTGGISHLKLSNLTSLILLNLFSNNFQSTLPRDLSRLCYLEYISVGDNSFVGSFPTFLFMISSLRMVSLGGNKFSGHIELGNTSSSSNLDSLFLGDNEFVGKIPQSLSRFSHLRELHLTNNNISGPIPQSIPERLRHLDLSYNNFMGPIPEYISEFLSVSYLDLSHNHFIGSVPKSLSKLNLFYLGLSNNKLEGEVPGFFVMWEVVLAQNAFSSFGKSWEALNDSEVSVLDLNSNSIGGPFPNWICKLRSLRILNLSNNLFVGSIPQCLRNSIGYLRVLILHHNCFNGIIPDIFSNATMLKTVDVSHNQLEGKLPRSMIKCQAMQFLNLNGNKIKDIFPSWLGYMSSLHVLILRSNQFHGTLYQPQVSTEFQSARVIDISQNYFTGTLPPSYFSNWRDMSTSSIEDDTLYVHMDEYMADDEYWPSYGEKYHNSMEMVNKGVEMEFGRIRKDYKAIDFSGNRLYGSIPESIGLLKGLRLLNLSGNAFTSNIPQSLANLTVLETLDVSRNKLSGHIPLELGNISSLSNMNFSHNFLEGSVPRGTQFQSQKCSSFMDNPKLDGLQEICGETHSPNPTTPQDSEDLTEQEEPVFNWIAAAIAYGPGIFCGLVIGHIWFMEKVRQNKPRVLTINTR